MKRRRKTREENETKNKLFLTYQVIHLFSGNIPILYHVNMKMSVIAILVLYSVLFAGMVSK